MHGEHPERYQDPLRYIYALNTLMEEIRLEHTAEQPAGRPADARMGADRSAAGQVSVHANMLRDSHLNDERREALMRDMKPLSTLALIVLLKTQARILRPTAPLSPSDVDVGSFGGGA